MEIPTQELTFEQNLFLDICNADTFAVYAAKKITAAGTNKEDIIVVKDLTVNYYKQLVSIENRLKGFDTKDNVFWFALEKMLDDGDILLLVFKQKTNQYTVKNSVAQLKKIWEIAECVLLDPIECLFSFIAGGMKK